MPELNVWTSRNLYWVSKSTKTPKFKTAKMLQKQTIKYNLWDVWDREKSFSEFFLLFWKFGKAQITSRYSYLTATSPSYLGFLSGKWKILGNTLKVQVDSLQKHGNFLEILENTLKVQVDWLQKLELTIKTLGNTLTQATRSMHWL